MLFSNIIHIIHYKHDSNTMMYLIRGGRRPAARWASRLANEQADLRARRQLAGLWGVNGHARNQEGGHVVRQACAPAAS